MEPINYTRMRMDDIHPEARKIAVSWMEGWEEWMKSDIRHKVKLASDIMNFAIAYHKDQSTQLQEGSFVDKPAIHYYHSEKHTGIFDKNGVSITDNCWIECDDQHYKKKAYHYVFWNDDMLCWSTVNFCNGNEKLDFKEELFRVKHRNPIVIEKPEWVTHERMASKLKYYSNAWGKKDGSEVVGKGVSGGRCITSETRTTN